LPEHSAITDPNIHEPKGVAAASANQIYIANGAGSGSWQAIPSTPETWTTVMKTANQTRTSSTAFADDTELEIAVSANTKYAIECRFGVQWGAGGTKTAFNGPASPTTFIYNGDSYAWDTAVWSNTTASGGNATSGLIFFHNGANAGTLKVRIAQNTSNAAASTFLAGSFLRYTIIT
jgi:hypothetical protein